MWHILLQPLHGCQASLFSLLLFALYSVSSCKHFSILILSSFIPYFLNILHKIGLWILGYAFSISDNIKTGVQSSITLLSFTYKTASSCSLGHVFVTSAVDLPTRNPSWSSSSTANNNCFLKLHVIEYVTLQPYTSIIGYLPYLRVKQKKYNNNKYQIAKTSKVKQRK